MVFFYVHHALFIRVPIIIKKRLYLLKIDSNTMTIKVSPKASKIELKKAIAQLDKSNKPFDASKYIGKIQFEGDPVEFQRELR
jgi:hypothetical protein